MHPTCPLPCRGDRKWLRVMKANVPVYNQAFSEVSSPFGPMFSQVFRITMHIKDEVMLDAHPPACTGGTTQVAPLEQYYISGAEL